MVSVKAFVDKIEAMVKDFHAGSPARVIKQPAKKDPFFASLYENEKDRKTREKREAKEQKKAKRQQGRTKKVKNGTNGCVLVAPFTFTDFVCHRYNRGQQVRRWKRGFLATRCVGGETTTVVL